MSAGSAPILTGIVIGLLAGVLSGLLGIGGGLIIVPALVLVGLTQREASGTSLAALLAPVAILGVMQYSRRHEIRWMYAAGIGIGLFFGVYVGARLAGKVSNAVLQRGFGVLLVVTGLRFLLSVRK